MVAWQSVGRFQVTAHGSVGKVGIARGVAVPGGATATGTRPRVGAVEPRVHRDSWRAELRYVWGPAVGVRVAGAFWGGTIAAACVVGLLQTEAAWGWWFVMAVPTFAIVRPRMLGVSSPPRRRRRE